MKEILEYYRSSLADLNFGRSEKKHVKDLIKTESISKEQRNLIRSEVFKMAKEAATDSNYFEVIDWLQAASQTLRRWQKDKAYSRVYFSPKDDCPNAIMYQLHRAKKKIDICVFTISDNHIVDKILTLHKSAIKIRIISDDDKVFDTGSDIQLLAEAGIPVKVDNSRHHMHHKFVTIDHKTVITGSYNWTKSAAEHNQENILITNDNKIVELYQREFNKLWEKFKSI